MAEQQPPLPPRGRPLPPRRPLAPHPGRTPTRSFIDLGEQAYNAHLEFETTRMRCYNHLGVPTPLVEINTRTMRSGIDTETIYLVDLESPDCNDCHGHHVAMKHKAYLTRYCRLPFLCLHNKKITALSITNSPSGSATFLPLNTKTVEPDNA